MPVAVSNATATLLPDGKVLVAGGVQGGNQVANAELYDPAAGTWSATGAMTVPRSGQSATLLPNGQVLVAGGGCNGHAYGCDSGSFEAPLKSAELYNPGTGTWTRTGSMKHPREYFTATLLKDGKVLAAGGFAFCDDGICGDNNSAELYDPGTGQWAVTGSMHSAREQHTATLLPNGEVLAAGGVSQGGFCCAAQSYSSAELYNPATGTWSATAPMATAHWGQTATLLRNGWVLIAGGNTSVAEIYEPQQAAWVSPGELTTARTGHTATLLPGGQVLVTGGAGPNGQPLATAEEFLTGPGPLVTVTPGTIAFGAQQVGSVSGFHAYTITNLGSADLMATGVALTGNNPGDFRATTDCASAPVAPGRTCTVRVRFAPGGTGLRSAVAAVTDNAPRSPHGAAVSGYGGGPNTWVPVGSMSTPRDGFTATLLPDGKVLVAGGEITTPAATAELYNPATRTFTGTGSMLAARWAGTATLLPDGKVLVAGGQTTGIINLSSAELYNPATGTWSATTPMNGSGYSLTSTLLPDGNVLVTGINFNSAEVYHPATATWTNTGPMTNTSQWGGTATLLPDGKVLVAGGATKAAELYDPSTNQWTATGSLNVARGEDTATLLSDGKVLVAGGTPPNAGGPLASAELYDPATGTWKLTGSMSVPRAGHTAALLPDGTVMVAGGCGSFESSGCNGNFPALASAEFFNTEHGSWSSAPTMTRPRVFARATLLPDGNLLMTGGDPSYGSPATTSAELYTPAVLSVNPASGPAGAQVTVSGSGYYAHESVKLEWDSVTVLGHVLTDNSGAFTTKVTIPQAAPGAHQIVSQGRSSSAVATATFTITG
jgi:uncharacterized delta-60 repeat protein